MAITSLNGEKTIQFMSHLSTYPIKIVSGGSGLSIINPTDTLLTFTIITQKGNSLSSVVPPASSYDGIFDAMDTIEITGATEFYAEVRI